MNINRFFVVGSVFLSLLFIITGIGIIGRLKSQRAGIFYILNDAISYNMTMSELESLLGEPKELTERSDGSIVLQYNIQTSYEKTAEVRFIFREGNHKLYQVLVKIRLDTTQEASMLFQQIRSDLMSEYESPFFFQRLGSLDGEVIGINLGIAINYVELMSENNTIILSGYYL